MNNIVLKTSADDLYEIVKSRKKISVEDAAKLLKMPVNTVQALVNFFVEEKIFGIEYKFTTPYIYINLEPGKGIKFQSMLPRETITKKEFFEKYKRWNIPNEKIDEMWGKYVEENIGSIKSDFYKKTNAKNISRIDADVLWKKYQQYL